MSDTAFQLIALAIYFAAMIAIGFWASRKNNNLDDYVLGGRGLTPGVAALSAGASDMSAWLLMGIPGIMYMVGLSEAWIIIGLTIGAWLNWKLVAPACAPTPRFPVTQSRFQPSSATACATKPTSYALLQPSSFWFSSPSTPLLAW